MTVWFGGMPADPSDTDVLSDTRIQTITPPGEVGVVDFQFEALADEGLGFLKRYYFSLL